jgi:hypothetical protein
MDRRRFIGTLATAVVGGLAGCGGPGQADKAAPPGADDQAGWVYRHDYERLPAVTSPGTAGGSRLYLAGRRYGADPSTVTAVDATDGTERWRSGVDIPVDWAAPDADGVSVAFDTRTDDYAEGTVPQLGRLAADGTVVWTGTGEGLDPDPRASFGTAGSATVVSNGQTVAVYDGATGQRRWREPARAVAGTAAATVYTVGDAGAGTDGAERLLARNAADGTLRWAQEFARVRGTVVGTDRVYVLETVDDRRVLHGLARSDGQRRWRADLGVDSYVGGAGLVGLDGGVLFAGTPIAAYSADGDELGRVPDPPGVSGPGGYIRARTTRQYVFLTAGQAGVPEAVVALDRGSYTVAWTRSTAGRLFDSADGVCYVLTDQRPLDGSEADGDRRTERRVLALDGRDGGRTVWDHWVVGTPVGFDEGDIYTELAATETALGGVYAYTRDRRQTR